MFCLFFLSTRISKLKSLSIFFSLFPEGLPQQPTNLQGYTLARNSHSATLNISWTAPSPANYDLEHYRVNIKDGPVKMVKDTSVLVNVSIPMSSPEMLLSVSVFTVNKCGPESEPKTAMMIIEAFNETPGYTESSIQGMPFICLSQVS